MQTTAKLNYVRVSPQKARLVIDLIRGRAASEALTILSQTNKRIAPQVEKLLRSAIANAEDTADVDVDELVVSDAYVNEGPVLYRLRAAAQGRAFRYKHKLSHIIVTVSDGRFDEDEGEDAE
ncbi:MAG: 50S ribosomal protein L22 [Solibacterales bacterium]|nr:50S ribosomal protein L22 [Bryobacterales bacterium]|tara:strand:+ start:3145 stop:3510 length:366 start_codon:yes stop_codon:yes gene_type:complete